MDFQYFEIFYGGESERILSIGDPVGIYLFVFSLTCVSNGEKMYSQDEVTKQFPVRLGNQLHDDLERISSETHINKSVLVRLSVEKLINEIDGSGVSKQLQTIYEG